MATGDLTTLANVKQYLGITSSNDDALIARLVSSASQYVQTWLNRTLVSTTYSEIRDGNSSYAMSPREYPITGVSSVTIDTVVVPLAADATKSGYRFDSERVVLTDYSFAKGYQNVVINYTAGYATIPVEIEQATIEMIANVYRAKDRVGVSSKSIGGESVSFFMGAMTDSIKTILNNYKQVAPQ
jgi:hypothetical protein